MFESISNQLTALHNDESGATATEYIILLILIACFVIGVVKVFGNTIAGKFQLATDTIASEVVL